MKVARNNDPSCEKIIPFFCTPSTNVARFDPSLIADSKATVPGYNIGITSSAIYTLKNVHLP